MRKSFKRRISTDEEMKEEMLTVWNNPFLKQHQRIAKMTEIKSRRKNIKKLSKEAENESFQRSLNRIRGGKPRSTRRLSVVSSGSGASSVRKSMTRRNSMTRTKSSGSLGQSDGNLNLSSHSNTQKRRSSVGTERRNSSSDLATSDYHLERKKVSSMKAWQRPQSRRLSM